MLRLTVRIIWGARRECSEILDLCIQVNIDFETEPIGVGKDGKNVFLRDIWPSSEEVASVSRGKCVGKVLTDWSERAELYVVICSNYASGLIEQEQELRQGHDMRR